MQVAKCKALSLDIALRHGHSPPRTSVIFNRIDPLLCHPGKDQNISGHIVLDQNVCVI